MGAETYPPDGWAQVVTRTGFARPVPEATDIGVDTRRGRVAIALSTLDRVQLWEVAAPARERR